MSNLRNVSAEEFDTVVLTNTRAVLIDFWAEWCAPCKALTPSLEKVSKIFDEKVSVFKVNVDEEPSIRDRFGIRGIPTLILMKDGQELARITGNRSATQLSSFLDSHLGTSTVVESFRFPLSAFGGDVRAKATYVTRLRKHIDTKLKKPNESLWDGDISSALQFVADETASDECARVLGIPPEVIALVETLSSYYGTNAKNAEFVGNWLDRVPVGSNLSCVPAGLLIRILESDMVSELIGTDSRLLVIRDELLSMHIAELEGVVVADAKWRDAKHASQELGVFGAMLAVAAMPLREDAELLEKFIPRVTMSVWRKLQADCGWKSGDEARMDEIAESIWQSAKQSGEDPPRGDALLDRMEKIDPKLLQRHRHHYGEGSRTMRLMGQQLGAMLLELTAQSRFKNASDCEANSV
jgi:thioredoxin